MYLKNEVAYQDREGTCRIEEMPVALAESYSENECDAIYVGLLSENDAEYEKVEEAFDEYLDSCEFDELVTLDGEANE